MTKVTMTLLALAMLAACEATTGATGPTTPEEEPPVEGTNPGAQGPGETPWWGL